MAPSSLHLGKYPFSGCDMYGDSRDLNNTMSIMCCPTFNNSYKHNLSGLVLCYVIDLGISHLSCGCVPGLSSGLCSGHVPALNSRLCSGIVPGLNSVAMLQGCL